MRAAAALAAAVAASYLALAALSASAIGPGAALELPQPLADGLMTIPYTPAPVGRGGHGGAVGAAGDVAGARTSGGRSARAEEVVQLGGQPDRDNGRERRGDRRESGGAARVASEAGAHGGRDRDGGVRAGHDP
jgi:hypothetical protein